MLLNGRLFKDIVNFIVNDKMRLVIEDIQMNKSLLEDSLRNVKLEETLDIFSDYFVTDYLDTSLLDKDYMNNEFVVIIDRYKDFFKIRI